MTHSLAGVVLAGGQSRRMGRPKALLRAGGGDPWLTRLLGLLRAAGANPRYVAGGQPAWSPPDATHVVDLRPDAGPLAGLESALLASPAEWLVVLACDLPCATPELVAALLWGRAPQALAVAARGPQGLEPLAACYARGALPRLRDYLDSGRRAARGFLDGLGACPGALVEVEVEASALFNANTPADLSLLARLDGPPGPEPSGQDPAGPA